MPCRAGIRRQARKLALLPNPEERLVALDRIAVTLERAARRQRELTERRIAAAHYEGYQDGLWEA
jgi:hypothetical protein